MYREMTPDAMQPHDTWIIAFCPNTDSFFVTNERAFYWEFEEEFESEEAGIYFFEHQIQYFIDVEEKLMSNMFITGWWTVEKIFLENTNKWYSSKKN